MAGHVPHVGDSRSGMPELGSGIESDLSLLTVPEVDPIVVCRVHWIDSKDLLENGIDRLMAVNRQAAASELPEAHTKERTGFDVCGVILYNALEIVDQLLFTLLCVLGLAIEVVGLSVDVALVLLGGFILKFRGFFYESLGPLFIFPIGHGHSPVGHGAVRILCGNLTKCSLGFIVPEAVQLSDSLIEKLLPFFPRALNYERDFTRSLNRESRVSRALIECFSLMRVTCLWFVVTGHLWLVLRMGQRRDCERD